MAGFHDAQSWFRDRPGDMNQSADAHDETHDNAPHADNEAADSDHNSEDSRSWHHSIDFSPL